MDKKSIGIIVVVILVLVVGGVLVISFQNKNNNESTNNSSQNVSDTTSTTSTQTSTDNDIEHGRYQEANENDLNIKVENKTLVMSFKGKNVKVSNLPSDVKYFSYITTCDGTLEIAVITNSNEVYHVETDLLQNLINLDEEVETEESVISKSNVKFDKLETNDAVDLSIEPEKRYLVSCKNKLICVVTSDGKLQEIDYDEDKQKYVVIK